MSNVIDVQALPDAYRRLARHLDNLPAGFPPTETGLELRILARLFTPEEAEVATGLIMMNEPATAIAARLGKGAENLEPLLLEMSRKGLIFRSTRDGKHSFMAAQFMVGIWEYHVNSLDEDLIHDVNNYVPTLMKKNWEGPKTKQFRVIPISQRIEGGAQVLPYDQAEAIIRRQTSIAVSPCICRREQAMVGKGCDKPLEVCLAFGGAAHFYSENGLGRLISQEEALQILQKGIEAGLVLQPGNAQKPTNICMCCACCCQVLKNLKLMQRPAESVHTSHVATVVAENCTVCGLCAERCPMEAITVDEIAEVNPDRCIGCGVCTGACQFEALTLEAKPETERYVPPKNIVETYVRIAKERGKL
jgi:Na+-translocating ferredoxin:NAD+ oxidoreductase subunit B